VTRPPVRDRLAVGVFRYVDARSKRRGTRVTPRESAQKPVAERLGGLPPPFVMRRGPRDLRVSEHLLPSGAALRCYQPSTRGDGGRPALLFVHGGGWIWGSTDVFDPLLRRAVAALGAVVVSVDYRLAPQHRFPAALEDCAAALAWVRDQADALKVDATRVAVMGDSAGGNLAAALALQDRDAGAAPPLVAQVLVYPMTDLALSDSWVRDYQGLGLTSEDCRQLVELYLTEDAERYDPLASPQHADTFAHLPPALVLTAALDPLREQGRNYASALADAGVSSRWVDFPGMPHGFFGADRLLTSAHRAQRLTLDVLAARLAAPR